jgi:hypothetical protein
MLARSTIAGTPVKSFKERKMNSCFTPHEVKDEVRSLPHLQKHTGRLERYLHQLGSSILPINDVFDILLCNLKTVTVADG